MKKIALMTVPCNTDEWSQPTSPKCYAHHQTKTMGVVVWNGDPRSLNGVTNEIYIAPACTDGCHGCCANTMFCTLTYGSHLCCAPPSFTITVSEVCSC